MPTTTRTLGPLHLEDLDPRRFEDLVRQLLYDFRPWQQLEATGRGGSDDGFDARGWEIVPSLEQTPAASADDGEPDESAEETRLWLVQCKREQSIGPKKLASYVNSVTEVGDLHGIVFVAACNFSKAARDRFRTDVRKLGVAEAHLWGRAEIEDQLFQPKNDHLLFAYFGISLRTRRRSLKTQIKARLAIKRKLMRLLPQHQNILLRDASDNRYPFLESSADQTRWQRGRWAVFECDGCKSDGLRVLVRKHFAFVDDDQEHWDFAEGVNDAIPHSSVDPWGEGKDPERRDKVWHYWFELPKQNRAWHQENYVVPYDTVLDIDEDGDEWFAGPHIYLAEFSPDRGPFADWCYETLSLVHGFGGDLQPDPAKRIEKFSDRGIAG